MFQETQETVDIRQCQGHATAGLGRVLSSKDERDREYLLPHRIAAAERVGHRYHQNFLPTLDQLETSECVIYSCDHYLTTLPVVNKSFGTPQERTRIYKQVQRMDEWPGENYDGTSVRAMMKWLKQNGYIKEYRWAFSCEPVIQHLLGVGPVLMGTTWTYNMFQPDRWGFIRPDDDPKKSARDWDVAGGHAYILIGANRHKVDPLTGAKGAVRAINSWGPNWGPHKGRFWMTFDDLDKLIKDYGEAAVPFEIKKAA